MKSVDRILGEAAKSKDRKWRDAGIAYFHAKNDINGPWPEGESVIAHSPVYSYLYALNLLKGRFLKGEPKVATDANMSYSYAKEVVNGRWPEGEPILASNPFWAYLYARDVLKARWPEAEAGIAASAIKPDYLETFPDAKEDWAAHGWIDWLDT